MKVDVEALCCAMPTPRCDFTQAYSPLLCNEKHHTFEFLDYFTDTTAHGGARLPGRGVKSAKVAPASYAYYPPRAQPPFISITVACIFPHPCLSSRLSHTRSSREQRRVDAHEPLVRVDRLERRK